MKTELKINLTIAKNQDKKYLIQELENQFEEFLQCLRHMITTDGHRVGSAGFLRNQSELHKMESTAISTRQIELNERKPFCGHCSTLENSQVH